MSDLEERFDLPMCGVVRPGAREAVRVSNGRPIAVIATEATINSDAYRRAIHSYLSGVVVHQRACPLFVGVVEEGRGPDDAVVRALADDYLGPLRVLDPAVLVLGCTHYPLLKPALSRAMGPDVEMVDSAEQTAAEVARSLKSRDALSDRKEPGTLSCYVSDNPQRFREIGQRFLSHPIVDVTWVSPEEFLETKTHSKS
jgi:glutamate racemase